MGKLSLTEKEIIARIRRSAKVRRGVVTGIGDDASVLAIPPGCEILVTTDFTLEGIHYRREWHSPEIVGRRCLTRGLSDIAAMGGKPVAVFLSLALPRKLSQSWVSGFVRGLLQLAEKFQVTLAGGDTSESPDGILADIAVVGFVPKGSAILRSGANPGDRIYVTGELGGASAALRELFSGRKIRPRDYLRHFYPMPRVAQGVFLREKGLASAMIDVSDGLSTDLAHICEESGVGAEIFANSIPRAVVGGGRVQIDLKQALHGGEDYELLFTAPPSKQIPQQIAGVSATMIGRVTRGKKLILARDGRVEVLRAQGWEHFRKRLERSRPDVPLHALVRVAEQG